jgi:hypothetical protein
MDKEKVRDILSALANWKDAGTEYSKDQLFDLRHFLPEWVNSNDKYCVRNLLPCLKMIWRFASAGQKDEAQRRVVGLIDRYVFLSYKLREDPSRDDYRSMKKAVDCILESLVWLGRNVDKLKFCQNPACDTGRTYFFREHSNDKYCCTRCAEEAKELRLDQHHSELNKPPKQYKRNPEQRQRMAESAERRWARVRAMMGRTK